MINVSNEFKQLLSDDHRKFLEFADITLKDGTVLNLDDSHIWSGGLKIEDAVSGSGNFQIGAAITNKCTLVVNNFYDDFTEYDFDGAEVIVYVGLGLSDGTVEKIRKGTFAVTDPSGQNSSLMTLECLDNMRKFDRPYSESKLSYPATLGQIITDACSVCGVPLATTAFDRSDYVVQSRPDDDALTFREIVSYAAQIACKWARCDVHGRLALGWYDETEITATKEDFLSGNVSGNIHRIESISDQDIALDDVVITGVRITETTEEDEEKSYLFGTEGYVISIEKNALVVPGQANTVAAMIGEKIVGLRFRPMSLSILEDPTMEAGDRAYVIDWKQNVYLTYLNDISFSPGDYERVSCEAETPARNSSRRFSELTKTYVSARKYAQKILGKYETQVDAMTKLISQGFGMNMGKITLPSGEVVDAMYDGPTPEESSYVCYWTTNGILASVDGGTTWAIDRNGNALFNTIAARGITADWIDSGRIAVKDKSGNTIFLVDMDTGQVLIEGSYVRIGDKTLDQALKDSGALSMQLDNDYANIPVNSDGNYTSIDVTVTPAVYYGAQNITADCNFTINESQNIAGNWDNNAKTYTVTDLTADRAWVDITAVYLGAFSITKRFSVAKLYGGADAVVYTLEASSDIVKITLDGYDNSSIVFSAHSRDGNGGQAAYSGRFRIITVTDLGEDFGIAEEIEYESEEDENSVTHILYDVLVDENGDALFDDSGAFLGSRTSYNVVEIWAQLYVAGGYDDLIGRKQISFLKDVSSLTQSEVFNILTNGGEDQGVYLVNGKLYLNFQYAVGQTLKLGGVGNANGLLEIYDSSGKKIGYIDSTGVNFEEGTFSGTLQGGSIEGAKISGSEIRSGVFYSTLSSSGRAVILQKGTVAIGTQDGTTTYAKISTISGSNGSSEKAHIEGKDGVSFGTQKSTLIPFYVTDELAVFSVPIFANGGFGSDEYKKMLVQTESYGRRSLYCYETPTPYYGDIGRGRIDENGIAYISIDDIFGETVNTEIEYDVMLTKYGQGDIWVDMELSDSMFFVVRGTPNLPFSWELKAIQKGYEYYRLDEVEGVVQEFYSENTELQALMDEELEQYDEEKEEFFDGEDIESISGD